MAEIQEKGEIVIGVKYDVPPFGFENPQTGDVEGFDVDLGNAIAEELGVEAKFVEAISDNRIPFLQDGTVDLILSTMTITEERDLEIDFSEPYFIARGRVLVPEGLGHRRHRRPRRGDPVCTALGSTYAETLKAQAPEAELRLVDDYSDCLELMQTGCSRRGLHRRRDPDRDGPIQDDTLELVGDRPHDRAVRHRHPRRGHGAEGIRGRGPRRLQGRTAAGTRHTRSGSASTRAWSSRPPDHDPARGDRAGAARVVAARPLRAGRR